MHAWYLESKVSHEAHIKVMNETHTLGKPWFLFWDFCAFLYGLFLFLSFFFYKCLFIFETESASRGEAERKRERISSRLCTVSTEPDEGLNLTNHEIMTWAEIKSQTLTRLSHPCTPRLVLTYLPSGFIILYSRYLDLSGYVWIANTHSVHQSIMITTSW